MKKKLYLTLECTAFFVGIPLLLWWAKERTLLMLALWVGTLLCGLYLHRHKAWPWRTLFAVDKPYLKLMLLRFVPLAIGLWLLAWWVAPHSLFSFPLQRPQTWAMVMLLYPPLSVVPQEVISRVFFHKRYAPVFQKQGHMIVASGLFFGLTHLTLMHWLPIVICVVGGMLFAHTYVRTKSLLMVSIEHALFGMWVFTLGLGIYFYTGYAWGMGG